MPLFKKILIANRGEIAYRIARSARDMGIQTVAVFSDADRAALHVKACDEAVHIGGNTPAASYLLGDNIIKVALDCGAEAIHPGFGFLSENADFAERCAENGLVFIGPSAEVIRNMGSKSAARQLMQQAGVPVLPGYDQSDQSETTLLQQAEQVGFPLLIKAVAGGGGKGLRAVDKLADFSTALAAVKRESLGAFGDDAVLLERYLASARHIEIQIFADSQGKVVHLFERDCSMQRRHQKVIEEAPAPGMTPELRDKMTQAAVDCAKAIDYLGAGTVEFLLAPDNTFYFMEMNTRLQVEHPVTEMISGQDLVAWQFQVANGQALPVAQSDLAINGHAIEARIYAENPQQNFLPSIGQLDYLNPPKRSEHIRIDTGVTEGDEISAYYDPMIAKLICWGENREQALSRLHAALKQYQLLGPKSNIRFLTRLCKHDAIQRGASDTLFIEQHLDDLLDTSMPVDTRAILAAALYRMQKQAQRQLIQQKKTADPWSPWAGEADHWRVGDNACSRFRVDVKQQTYSLAIAQQSGTDQTAKHDYAVTVDDHTYAVQCVELKSKQIKLIIDGSLCGAIVIQNREQYTVLIDGLDHSINFVSAARIADQIDEDKGALSSPMPGKIIACHTRNGATVSQGDTLMVVEAMKMEHAIIAPQSGEIAALHFQVGDQVEDGDILLSFAS